MTTVVDAEQAQQVQAAGGANRAAGAGDKVWFRDFGPGCTWAGGQVPDQLTTGTSTK